MEEIFHPTHLLENTASLYFRDLICSTYVWIYCIIVGAHFWLHSCESNAMLIGIRLSNSSQIKINDVYFKTLP